MVYILCLSFASLLNICVIKLFRSKPTLVRGDNCCLCNLAGVKAISKLSDKEILYASFKNHIFEVSTQTIFFFKILLFGN